jgi:hypothetical protein
MQRAVIARLAGWLPAVLVAALGVPSQAPAEPELQQGSTHYTLELGDFKRPGSCPSQRRYADVRPGEPVLAWGGGQAKVSVRVWPEPRVADQKNLRLLRQCLREGRQGMDERLIGEATPQGQSQLQEAANQCLARQGADFRLRAALLRLGEVRCDGR